MVVSKSHTNREYDNVGSSTFFITGSSTHPCSGPAINTLEEEECKRFSFGGFNSKVDVGLIGVIEFLGYYERKGSLSANEEKWKADYEICWLRRYYGHTE